MPNGETKLMGLLGHGISSSLSPVIHNDAAKRFNKNIVYINFDLQPSAVPDFLQVLWELGGQGINITAPHKNLVASLVKSDGLSSVNTLVRSDQGWVGYSTDGLGFIHGLKRLNASILDFETIIVLGAGGAVQSILQSIVTFNVGYTPQIIIHRRTRSHDHKIMTTLGQLPETFSQQIVTLRSMDPDSVLDTVRATSDSRRLIIQGTSAPKFGDKLSQYRVILPELNQHDLIVDLIYDKPSDLYFSAIAKDLRCLDGLPMLVEQARLSQTHWWGQAATYDDIVMAIKKNGRI